MVLATVAIHHFLGQRGQLLLSPRCTFMVMDRKSKYFTNLSADAKCRYEGKVTNSGLRQDPYAITEWTENPENVPEVQWSDLMLYMVTTPSPYTREEIKVKINK